MKVSSITIAALVLHVRFSCTIKTTVASSVRQPKKLKSSYITSLKLEAT